MMLNRRKLLQVTASLIVLGCAVYLLLSPKRGEVIEKWQTTNDTFRIRVTAYNEKNSFPALGGAYYIFESAPLASDTWTEIMSFRHDDPVAIPREQVRFVNPQVGYLFMGWMYAVTTDGGSTWCVWNAEKQLQNWQSRNYNLIRAVRVAPDGTGIMTLHQPGEQEGGQSSLSTKDFGRHWTIP